MNNKIIAVIIVAVLVAAGVGVYFLLQNQGEKDREINLISGVNIEGSGIYIKSDVDINTMFDFSTEIPTPLKAGWEGKVFGTPGTATIQHVQLLTIVKSMGMNFTLYLDGAPAAPNTVYFVANIFNATAALGDSTIDGGSLWEPQYEKIIADSSNKFKALVTTNDLFPGHACCVIAGYHGYTSTHQAETTKFVAAFVEATNWVNDAKANPNGENYAQLLEIAKEVAGNNFTDQEVRDALDIVTYFYGDENSTPLAGIGGQVATLSENLIDLGTITRKLSELGFENGEDFVKKFVDDQYLLDALKMVEDGSGKSNSGELTEIKVAVIAGDIHQIAIHVAIKLGLFEGYGLKVTTLNQSNGPGVAVAIQNGEAQFGLLGAPPLTINVINGELVKA
ncbi:MAG: ABC transporter substrate-binding protein [Candidatus Methanoplasma sp.]|nr:ABC transporter substrate-binding protein [Candidatus Methanoplasma sp.]